MSINHDFGDENVKIQDFISSINFWHKKNIMSLEEIKYLRNETKKYYYILPWRVSTVFSVRLYSLLTQAILEASDLLTEHTYICRKMSEFLSKIM